VILGAHLRSLGVCKFAFITPLAFRVVSAHRRFPNADARLNCHCMCGRQSLCFCCDLTPELVSFKKTVQNHAERDEFVFNAVLCNMVKELGSNSRVGKTHQEKVSGCSKPSLSVALTPS